MPHEVIMPALGMAQDTGKIVSWLKSSGDAVKTGDALFEVETDKACCAGNKYALQQGCPSLMTVLRRDSVMPFLHPMGNHSECYGPCFVGCRLRELVVGVLSTNDQ